MSCQGEVVGSVELEPSHSFYGFVSGLPFDGVVIDDVQDISDEIIGQPYLPAPEPTALALLALGLLALPARRSLIARRMG